MNFARPSLSLHTHTHTHTVLPVQKLHTAMQDTEDQMSLTDFNPLTPNDL
jgi:hypothetical protein